MTHRGKALFRLGGYSYLTESMQTQNTVKFDYRRHTAGAKVRSGEGNSPDRQLRSQSIAKWETKWEGLDSQEVGLEAATF